MKNNSNRGECVFCEIVSGRSPAHIVCENEHGLALLDINPLSRGHCLVIPKRHIPWWHEMTKEETASLYEIARLVALKMKEALKPDFIYQLVHGRRIPHTHIFIVPSFDGDIMDRFLNLLGIVQESPGALMDLKNNKALAETAELLRVKP